MALNHLSHLKIMEEGLWNDFSDTLMDASRWPPLTLAL